MLNVQNVAVMKLIFGHRRQGQGMKQKQNFSSAQNASIPGENTDNGNKLYD